MEALYIGRTDYLFGSLLKIHWHMKKSCSHFGINCLCLMLLFCGRKDLIIPDGAGMIKIYFSVLMLTWK